MDESFRTMLGRRLTVFTSKAEPGVCRPREQICRAPERTTSGAMAIYAGLESMPEFKLSVLLRSANNSTIALKRRQISQSDAHPPGFNRKA